MKQVMLGILLVLGAILPGCIDDENSKEQPQLLGGKTEEMAPKKKAETLQNSPWVIEETRINKIETVDGTATIQNPDNDHVLVNEDYTLPAEYKPDDLVVPDVRFSFEEDVDKRYLRAPAAQALEKLFASAKEDGIELFAVSGYRSYDRQETIFSSAVAERGEEAASQTIAYPGNSEHQTGLAMDVSSHSNQFELTTDFAETDEGKWVKNHAHEHGFIIRYPKGKEMITGISFEPWHLRYVGTETASVIVEHEITLEEFFERVQAI